MTLFEALRVLRRWRSVILAGILIGVVVGWVSAPGKVATASSFRATHTLILAPGSRDFSRLTEAVARATFGAVPSRVATRLEINRSRLRAMVSFETPEGQDALLITGQSANRVQAELLANVTAEELILELGGPTSPLRTLEPAIASPVKSDSIEAPTSPAGRALLLGAFGLLFGVCAAFAVARFDNRVRSKASAEDALGVPVMSEVPRIARSNRGRLLLGTEHSSFIEAYRRLRTSVVRWSPQPVGADSHRVIVVVSATGGEGTTTTVAHLAVTLGELGRSVVAISADLRHPRLHFYFDKAPEPGLTDVLGGASNVRRLADLDLATTIRGVRLVSSGAPVRNPAPLLDHIGDHLRDARGMGDLVLIDAPPLLTTSDGPDLARHADGVLLVVRSGLTSVGAAARSVELLERLGVPILGAVLVGSDASAVRL
jgi:Mrp family chromosome partitioning ATPase